MDATLTSVLRAWELSAPLHEPNPGCSADELAEAARVLDRRLPAAFKQLYAAHGGGSFLHGNLMLEPLLPPDGDDDALAVTTNADELRAADWPIPHGLVMIGGNGSDDLFGLWLPGDAEARPLAVQVGEIFEPASFAVVGDDLESFLAGWTAYYLLLLGDELDVGPALDALGVPAQLRVQSSGLGDEDLDALLAWASPHLPDVHPDPYERGLTADDLAQIARAVAY
jgi:hypothetical protein